MLEVNDLRVAYGGIQAVRGISFHVNEGEMVALIGANGAGKTSTLKALSRLLDLAGGSVRYRGKEISGLPPHELVGEGIALVPEGRGVFPRMSIVENLLMGAYSRRDKAGIEADMAHVFSLLPRLNELSRDVAQTSHQLNRVLRIVEETPQGLIFGPPAVPPGPGETGFVARGGQ